MNQKNAEAKGRAEGQAYQRMQRGLHDLMKGLYFLPREEYERQGRIKAQSETRSIQVQKLFIKGWNDVWNPSKPIEHNPNSRFCSCPECMKG
ncbi:MAG TPA: hypothetical protein VF974_00735 [Patescibacteria group bacterium]